MTKAFLDLLSDDEQDDWQSIEYWTYANDGERPSTEWGDGPRYLGLGLLDWAELADTAPRLVEICGMEGAIGRWRFNHPDPEQQRRWFTEHDVPEPVELTEVQKQQVHNVVADIPKNDPSRDFLVSLAELVITAKPNEEAIEALKGDIAEQLLRNLH